MDLARTLRGLFLLVVARNPALVRFSGLPANNGYQFLVEAHLVRRQFMTKLNAERCQNGHGSPLSVSLVSAHGEPATPSRSAYPA